MRSKSINPLSLLLLVMMSSLLWMSLGLGAKARLVPSLVGAVTVGLLLIQTLRDFLRSRSGFLANSPASGESSAQSHEAEPHKGGVSFMEAMLWTFLMYVGFMLVGYTITLPVLLYVYLVFQVGENWRFSLAYSIISGLIVFLVFRMFIGL